MLDTPAGLSGRQALCQPAGSPQQRCRARPQRARRRGAQGTAFAKADKKQLAGVFTYLDFCLEQIVKDNELGALRQALEARARAHLASVGAAAASGVRCCFLAAGQAPVRCACVRRAAAWSRALTGALRAGGQGGYVEPGPGGDPIRNPGVLPTGKNIHALDPQAIPTQAAVKSARIVVERCAPAPGRPARRRPARRMPRRLPLAGRGGQWAGPLPRRNSLRGPAT